MGTVTAPEGSPWKPAWTSRVWMPWDDFFFITDSRWDGGGRSEAPATKARKRARFYDIRARHARGPARRRHASRPRFSRLTTTDSARPKSASQPQVAASSGALWNMRFISGA